MLEVHCQHCKINCHAHDLCNLLCDLQGGKGTLGPKGDDGDAGDPGPDVSLPFCSLSSILLSFLSFLHPFLAESADRM